MQLKYKNNKCNIQKYVKTDLRGSAKYYVYNKLLFIQFDSNVSNNFPKQKFN